MNAYQRSVGHPMRFVMLAAIGCLIVEPASSQNAEVERRVRSMDTNRDGQVTPEEFTGAADKFALLDHNQDGVIASEELDMFFKRRSESERETRGVSDGVMPLVYQSSVDGATCHGTIWMPEQPASSRPNQADQATLATATPLVIFLGGGPGNGEIATGVLTECQRRGWMAMGLAGRRWKPGTIKGCAYQSSMAYLDHPNPAIGPGQQDILDGIDWAIANLGVDPERVYLCGFSLGGRGAYMMGLKCPDRFAAIAAFAPATDMFELDIRTPSTRDSYGCRMALAEGIPGSGPRSDTLRSIQSGRFLIENAYNLPVFHGHGTADQLAMNLLSSNSYQHGYHVTIDSSWSGTYEFNGKKFAFGHTPTLAELHARHPGGYRFAYMFTRLGHGIDRTWLTGKPIEGNTDQGVIDPDHPNRWLGAFDFFARARLITDPDTVVYKSYTDDLKKAYWLSIDVRRPWENSPGAVRAGRDTKLNRLQLETVRLKQLTIDLDAAHLSVTPNQPLGINCSLLVEEIFDPALRLAPEEPTDLSLRLTQRSFRQLEAGDIRVTRSGAPLAFQLTDEDLTMHLPNISEHEHLLEISRQ